MGSRLKVKEKSCKTALSKTGISSYDYTINPYTGCQNGCTYCYANFMRRFSGHFNDPWGSFVDVKVNLLDVLAKELPRRPGGIVWLSSVCDPYQPLEKKYELTRRTIERVSRYSKFSLSILTKNVLVLRDLDLLESMKDRIDVGFTITTFSSTAQSVFEPHASHVNERIKTLERLSQAGIDTWVFIAPILPYATEEGLEEGLRCVADAGVKRLMTDRYNARGMIMRQTLQAYKRWRPNIDLQEIRELLWHGNEYYRRLDSRIAILWQGLSAGSTHEAVF